MKRGWILVYTVFLVTMAFLIPCFFLSSVSTILGVASGVMVVIPTLFLLIYFKWAPRNLFFTFVPEGRAKAVVRGDAFKKALIQWEGHDLSSDSSDVWDLVERPTRRRLFGGLKFYGFWPLDDIYLYDFTWFGVASNGEVQSHVKETIAHILLKPDVYWAKVVKAEDKQLLPVDVELVLTIRIINPYKALFCIQNWLETVINRIEPAVRNRMSNKTYDQWITGKADLAQQIYLYLSGPEGEEGLLDKFRSEYGVDVLAIEVRSINPPENYRETTLKGFIAEREKAAIVVTAEAERKRIEMVYEVVQKYGDLGRLLRTLEAVEKSPLAASLAVQAIPGLQEAFRGVFQKPSESDATPPKGQS